MEEGNTLKESDNGLVLNLRPHLRQHFSVFDWAGGATVQCCVCCEIAHQMRHDSGVGKVLPQSS
jgi:hypothetical protein